MSGGLFKEEEQSRKDEKEDMDDKHISINPPVTREKKKTPKERRKQKAAKTLVRATTISLSLLIEPVITRLVDAFSVIFQSALSNVLFNIFHCKARL